MSGKIANRCPQLVDNSGAISTGGELVEPGYDVIGHGESAPTGNAAGRLKKECMGRSWP
jgi:hypothetical protein